MSDCHLTIKDLYLRYSDGKEALKNISLDIPRHAVSVLFGPSGGGKSSLLRVLNRLIDSADVEELRGQVHLGKDDLLAKDTDVTALRRRVGMVFFRPIPLPMTIRENMIFGLEAAGNSSAQQYEARIEEALKQAALWDEVNDRLDAPASALSGGQQQRLCLARILALQPEIILLDEPTSALDPITTARIEQFLLDARERYTIVLAPHNQQQAARMADFAAFFLEGEIIETGIGKSIFLNPRDKRTQDYVEGRFG